MGNLSLGKILDCLCISSPGSCSCFCLNTFEGQDEFEKKPLMKSDGGQLLRLKDVVSGNQTLAFQLKPKMVVVIGDIIPFEVLESVSKVKNAELWSASCY
ncbi:hypothetical protein CISIN_1g032683mg [Citrus sinensis]|uniref:Uncharacterized protein n=1 Tax=Citrus sinensis TaxID=2711 RepID=A0A067ETC7_CITSI|nr:hypothetical protein CISIN_1g032683mg [Citrus sinensis]KDO54152.1 hypothetical protein CISIN_1g032683mg [Citrus sinensis]